jgi:hypothetical protein
MITDPELDQWSKLFRSQQSEPAEIVSRAKKAVRRFRLIIYSEIAVTVVAGGGATIWALNSHQTSVTLLAIWIWISIAAAWLFRLKNDWNDFTGVAVATGSYLNTLLRRLRSNLRAADFSGILFAVQLCATSAWVFSERNGQSHITLRDYLSLPPNIFFAVGTVAFYIWLFFYRRKLQTQIQDLTKLQLELGDQPGIDQSPTLPTVLDHALGTLHRLRKRKLRVF